jgi:deazaflavin-dependent oxidoreductase (nitroreductase family)
VSIKHSGGEMDSPILQPTESTRQAFKYFLNPLMVLMWRLGLGGWLNASPKYGGRLMVLTHIGRKSGTRRRQPLNYAIVDGELYCTAGFGRSSDWYKNIMANPNVEVWLPDGWWVGMAEDVSEIPERTRLLREVIIASGLAGYAAGVDTKKMSDAELEAVSKDYRLIHIRHTERRTRQDGAGDLSWTLSVAALGVVGVLVLARTRRLRGHPQYS